jgi:hypothetical protein
MIADDLDPRLAALEARVPVEASPSLPEDTRRPAPHIALSLAAALVLALAVGATAIAGAAVTGLIAFGAPGVENPGQPLAGANLECMSPPDAAAYLAAHGFTNVAWQVETTTKDPTGTTVARPDAIAASPPEHGYVVPGAIVDGQLHMIVDQRAGATGTGACVDMPMP